jgi:hypothetical protein
MCDKEKFMNGDIIQEHCGFNPEMEEHRPTDWSIAESNRQRSEFFRKASQNANVNPFAPDEE